MNQAAAIRLGPPTQSAAVIDMATLLGTGRQRPPRSLEEARQGADRAATLASAPENITFESQQIGELRCEWTYKNDNARTDSQIPVIVYAHGGGFVVGSVASHRNICAHITSHTGWPTINVEYRLAPEHPYPAPVDDMETVCAQLDAQQRPIVLAGDSAGANIALACAIRRAKHNLPTVAVALFSPMIDLTFTAPSITTNAATDSMLSVGNLRHGAAAYVGDVNNDDPQVSPLLGSLTGLAPVIVHASTTEMLYNDATRLAESITSAGGEVTFFETVDVPHVVVQGAGNVPEADEVLTAFAQRLQQIHTTKAAVS
jgi:epsilon-lactone hydrolase